MSLLTTATKRILGKDLRQAPCPVPARDSYRTHLFSMHDQSPPPSPRLLRTALDAFRLVADGKITLDDLASRPNIPDYFNVWPGEHYRVLAALVHLLQPRTIIEIGTFSGLSAIAMKKYLPAEGRITTFDVVPWHTMRQTVLTDADLADGRLEQRVENLIDESVFTRNRALLEAADFLFIDAPKDGVFEYRLMEFFKTITFRNKPLAWFDDTRLWSMLRFWRELPYPKMDVTSLASWSGSGLAEL